MLAVPNVSEGSDQVVIEAIAAAIRSEAEVALLDIHSDPDHNRSVYTFTGPAQHLGDAVVRAARQAIAAVDLTAQHGLHPRVGAIDVVPIVYLDDSERGLACAEALVVADRLSRELDLPVFLYGELSGGRVTRADLRGGGPEQLGRRIEAGELTPDFGPARLHRTAGAVLVSARPPLIAFNVELTAPADLQTARRIAALIREGGQEGLPGVRAIGLTLPTRGGVAQVSMNIEDYTRTSPAEVVRAITRHAQPLQAELIGLAPREAFTGFPADLTVTGRRHIEDLLH